VGVGSWDEGKRSKSMQNFRAGTVLKFPRVFVQSWGLFCINIRNVHVQNIVSVDWVLKSQFAVRNNRLFDTRTIFKYYLP